MKKNIRFLNVLLVLCIILVTVTSCANKVDDNPGGSEITSDSTNKETEKNPSGTTEQPEKDEPILADLNDDGTDDKIVITYDDEQKSSATIKVINGKDDSELMTDTLKLGANKFGAYYLQIGKGNERDKLVFWHYSYRDDGTMAFTYSVFSYDTAGKATYAKRGGKTFDVTQGAAIAAQNQIFLSMVLDINENIQATDSFYNGYLLLDNHGDNILLSTSDNMLAPTDLLFELDDFVVDKSAE